MVQTFETLGLRLNSSDRDEIADSVAAGFAASFRNEGSRGGRWPRLTFATQADRRRKGFPPARPILERTGSYRDSFARRSSDHYEQWSQSARLVALESGSEHRLLDYLEGGTSRMPARPVTDLTDQNENEIGDTLDSVMARMFARWGQ
jgi:phage gpG-like protein